MTLSPNVRQAEPVTEVAAGPVSAPSPQRLSVLVAALSEGLVERDEPARLLLLAALAGEHLLIVGPPGTAKSELARRLHRVVGGRWFERLLTRFTVPEEVFGPMSLAALDEGRYERDIAGYLPDASVAFLDEVFRANSAILNALLALLNERVFDQGALRIRTPLVALVGAANEIPEDETLRAFLDRFLVRCFVEPVSDAGFSALLEAGGPTGSGEPANAQLSIDELEAARRAGLGVRVPAPIVATLAALRAALRDIGVEVSDRRWVRAVSLLRVAAATAGRGEVGLDDLLLLKFVLPERADQVSPVESWLLAQLGADAPLDPVRARRIVEAFEKQIEIERSATELAFDDSGKLAIVQKLGGAEPDAMSGAAPRMSAFSRRRVYGATHIRARIEQIDQALSRFDAFADDAEVHRRRLAERLAAHPWLAPAFALRVSAVLDSNAAAVAVLRDRLRVIRDAFAGLPLADEDDGKAPAPVPVDG
jgi:MoxR-like ATPase